jgi:DNA-binding phage protein
MPQSKSDPIHARATVLAELNRRDMSVNALALAAGVAQPVLQRWLAGTREIKLDTLSKVLGAVGYKLVILKAKKGAK